MRAVTSLSAVLLVVVIGSGCTATYVRGRVSDGALDKVAKAAASEYAVTRIDENTIHLRDSWVWSSIGGLGWYTSHARLHHDRSSEDLHVKYYLRGNGLSSLWISTYLDAEPGFVGLALKPTMNAQIAQILRWAGASTEERKACGLDDPLPPS